MPILQPIVNISELCFQKGLEIAVISPGSRSAALTLAFARHPHIKTYMIADERSAAFVALGMAQAIKKTVALVCTSGTAALNFAPAVAEAYFQQIPLLVLTADRPVEWTHQHDGQTVFQQNVFGKHAKEFIQLPADYQHPDSLWFINRSLNHALDICQSLPAGPVHVNIPIREPFYPTPNEVFVFEKPRIIRRYKTEAILSKELWHSILNSLESYERILIAGGQQVFNEKLLNILAILSEELKIPVLADVISNLPHHAFINNLDAIFHAQNNTTNLRPELLITFGNSFISKGFKQFSQKHTPQEHWHLATSSDTIDAFQSLTDIYDVSPLYFFEKIVEDIEFRKILSHAEDDIESEYLNVWEQAKYNAKQRIEGFLRKNTTWADLQVLSQLLEKLPENAVVHLANSMSVRYANLIGVETYKNIEIYSNRGTSGIDGCTSTAVGYALCSEKQVFLLTGDVAFFYDRNAFWNDFLPQNLHIILLNNGGGNIFSMIDGSSQQPELKEFFEMNQPLNAKHTAQDAGIEYFAARNFEELSRVISVFFDTTENAKILEIFTNADQNAIVWHDWKAFECT